MADYTLSAKITGDASELEQAFSKAQNSLKTFSSKMKGLGNAFSGMGKALMPISTAVGRLGVATGKTSVEFLKLKENTRIAFKALLSSAESAESMLNNLYTFAKTTPFSYDTYLQAGKQLVAMGVAAKDAIPYLDGITNAAIATGHGQEGITTLSEAIGRMSSKGKVQLEELNRMIELGVPAVKILGNAYGVTETQIYDMLKNGELLTNEALPKLISGMNEGTNGVNGATAAYGGLASEMKGSLSGAIDSLKSKFQSMSVELWNAEESYPALTELIRSFTAALDVLPQIFSAIGQAAGPVLAGLSEKVKSFSEYVKNADPSQLQHIGSTILGLAAGSSILLMVGKGLNAISTTITSISTIGGVITDITGKISSLGGVSGILKTAFSGITSASGLVVLGIGAIIGIIAYLLSTNEEFRSSFMEAWLNIQQAVMPVVQQLGELFKQIGGLLISVFSQIAQAVMPIIILIISTLSQLFIAIMPVVQQVLTAVMNIISAMTPIITTIIGLITNIIQTIMPPLIAIINVIMGVIQALMPVIMSIIGVVMQVIMSVIEAVTPIIQFIAEIIAQVFQAIAPIIQFIAEIIGKVIQIIMPIVTFIAGVIAKVIGVIRPIMDVVSNVFSTIFSTISNIMGRVGSAIQNVFGRIRDAWEGLKSFVGTIFDGISGAVQTLVNTVKGFINGVVSGINAAIGLINKIPGVSIGMIPYLLHGTDDWQGGFARMNEGGRGELTYLPDGTQVIPHDLSVKYAKEAARAQNSAVNTATNVIQGGDVFNFYGKTETPAEHARAVKKAKEEFALDF